MFYQRKDHDADYEEVVRDLKLLGYKCDADGIMSGVEMISPKGQRISMWYHDNPPKDLLPLLIIFELPAIHNGKSVMRVSSAVPMNEDELKAIVSAIDPSSN